MISRIPKIDLYDFAVMLYVVAIFAFENQVTANLFRTIQLAFLLISMLVIFFRRKILVNSYLILQSVFLTVVLIVSMFLILNGNLISNEFYLLFSNAVKILILLQYVRREQAVQKIILSFVIGGLIASSFIIFDFLSIEGTFDNLKYAGNYRLGADISGGNVNITGLNLSFSFAACCFFLYNKSTPIKWKYIDMGIMGLIFFAMLLTGSRKILIFSVITFLMQTYVKSKKGTIIALLTIFIVYMCLLNIEVLYFYIGHKIDILGSGGNSVLYNESDTLRKNLIYSGWQLFANNLTGVGIGGVAKELGLYAHNNFIEILASVGIIGFIIYYSMYLYPLFKLRKATLNSELSMFFISSIFGMLAIEWFQVTYLYKIPMILLAIANSYVALERRKFNTKDFDTIKVYPALRRS